MVLQRGRQTAAPPIQRSQNHLRPFAGSHDLIRAYTSRRGRSSATSGRSRIEKAASPTNDPHDVADLLLQPTRTQSLRTRRVAMLAGVNIQRYACRSQGANCRWGPVAVRAKNAEPAIKEAAGVSGATLPSGVAAEYPTNSWGGTRDSHVAFDSAHLFVYDQQSTLAMLSNLR